MAKRFKEAVNKHGNISSEFQLQSPPNTNERKGFIGHKLNVVQNKTLSGLNVKSSTNTRTNRPNAFRSNDSMIPIYDD